MSGENVKYCEKTATEATEDDEEHQLGLVLTK